MSLFIAFMASSKIGQWLKSKLFILIVIFFAILLAASGYFYIDAKARESEQNKIALDKQARQIEKLNKDIEKLIGSNKITMTSLISLFDEKKEVDARSELRNVVVKKKVKEISQSSVPPEEKASAVSRVYIESLYKNYCSIQPENCPEETKK